VRHDRHAARCAFRCGDARDRIVGTEGAYPVIKIAHLAPFAPFVDETLAMYPRLVATRLFEMLRERGYEGSIRSLRKYVQTARPQPKKEAYLRIETLAGEQAQIDWAHVGEMLVPGGRRALWVFLLVLPTQERASPSSSSRSMFTRCADHSCVPLSSSEARLGSGSAAQLLEQVCVIEQRRERDARNLARHAKSATIGPCMPLDKFDWNHPRAVDRQLYESLATLDFLKRGENVLFRGQAGVGKTSLAQNLGLRALERGHTVRFSTVSSALVDLLRQESLPATERRLLRYTSPDLLILDELGYVPCDSPRCRPLVQRRQPPPRRALDRDHHQPRLQAVGHRVPRRLLPRCLRRPLRSALLDADSWRNKQAQQRSRSKKKPPEPEPA
jgi:hypothetical protein